MIARSSSSGTTSTTTILSIKNIMGHGTLELLSFIYDVFLFPNKRKFNFEVSDEVSYIFWEERSK